MNSIVLIEPVYTNPEFCVDEIRISHHGIYIRVGRQTGNFHPDGKAWQGTIHAAHRFYADASNWCYGHGSWGENIWECILNAVERAEAMTVQFPDAYLSDVVDAVESYLDNTPPSSAGDALSVTAPDDTDDTD